MARLEGKVALITGGARGLGASHAKAFIGEGAKVVITDINEDAGKKTADDLGENCEFLKHDVTSSEDWDRVVSETEAKFGPINVLVNNAGIAHSEMIEDHDVDNFEKVYKINQFSVFLGLRAVIPSMKKAENGSIVNISSLSGIKAQVGNIAYNASKFAVRGMTKTAALEFAEFGIRVNSVHPGIIKTPMTSAEELQDQLNQLSETIPMKRIGDAQEVTNLVVYLASDESSYSTGSEFLADGGLTSI